MLSRPVLAVALATMLAATGTIAFNAFAQQGGPRGPAQGPASRMSAEDHSAFFEARIAAVKAGLRLTPEQERLWPAVETAVREGFAKRSEMMQKMQTQGRPADPIEAMRRMADASTARGEAMKKVVDAAQPLYTSLNDDQKRRLQFLMRGPGGRMAEMHERMRGFMGRDSRDERGPRGPGFMGPRGGDDRFGPREREDRKSTRLNSSHIPLSRMPSSA